MGPVIYREYKKGAVSESKKKTLLDSEGVVQWRDRYESADYKIQIDKCSDSFLTLNSLKSKSEENVFA